MSFNNLFGNRQKIPESGEESILPVQPIASEASSYDAFAQTLGSLADRSLNEVQKIGTDISNTALVDASTQAKNLAIQAHIDMIHSPADADAITTNTLKTLKSIPDGVKLNVSDSSNLDKYIGTLTDGLRVKAAETSQEQLKRGMYINLENQWPTQLQEYQDAAVSGNGNADAIQKSLVNNIGTMYKNGVLPRANYLSKINDLSLATDVAKDQHDLYNNPNANAQDLHAVLSSPLNANVDTSKYPVDQNFKFMQDHYTGDTRLSNALNDIYQGKLPNSADFDNMTDVNRAIVKQSAIGYQQAQGIIRAGLPYQVVMNEFDNIVNNRSLSYADKAKKEALQNYLYGINYDYASTIGQTPAGQAVNNDFVQNMNALQSQKYSPQQMAENVNRLYNQRASALVNIGRAQNIPDTMIVPQSDAELQQAKSAFTIGNDPKSLFNTMNRYSITNQARMAGAFTDPNQKMVINALAYLPDADSRIHGISNQEKTDFIAANQTGVSPQTGELTSKGRKFDKVLETKDSNDKALSAVIYANLTPQLQLLRQISDREKYPDVQTPVLSSTLKYARYLADQNNDPLMNKGVNYYANQASRIYGKAFTPRSGSNYIVNGTDPTIRSMSDSDLSLIANDAISKGYEYLLNHHPDTADTSLSFDAKPLKMIITNTGEVQAVDNYGNVAFREPLSSTKLSALKIQKQKEEAANESELENIKATQGLTFPGH